MNIITGYTGEPHITSAQDRDGNQGAYGTGSYILNVGAKMAASIVSVNEIRISDGALCHQGCLGNIDKGLYESVAIANGTQGMKRRDLIVCRYEKQNGTNVESLTLAAIQGTPTSGTPEDPSYNTGDIQSGDTPVDMPLYRVNINGVNISSVTRIAPFVRTQTELGEYLGSGSLPTTASDIAGAVSELYTANVGMIGLYSDKNIDHFPANNVYGVFWLNNGDTQVAGTKPISGSSQGLLFSLRQSTTLARQVYIGITASGNYVRYYTYSTGVWTEWSSVTI